MHLSLAEKGYLSNNLAFAEKRLKNRLFRGIQSNRDTI
jgi:hypothetical protein